MKSQVTKTDTPQGVRSPLVVDRLNTSIIRTCLLNLIAQIALGTPMAAQAQRNSRPALMDRENMIAVRACPDSVANKGAAKKPKTNEGRCTAQSKPNVIATETETNEKNSKEK